MNRVLLTACLLVVSSCSRPAPCDCTSQPSPTRSATTTSSTVPATPASAPAAAPFSWPESAATDAELSAIGAFNPTWNRFDFNGMKLAVAVEVWPTDGESYIDLHGYVYNLHFREWRRFFGVKVRGAGGVDVRLEEREGLLVAVGTANNDLREQRVFVFDLRAVHDDR
jgi:hypothetical protein